MINLAISTLITIAFAVLVIYQTRRLSSEMCDNPKFSLKAKIIIQRVITGYSLVGLVIFTLLVGIITNVSLKYSPLEYQTVIVLGQLAVNQLGVVFAYRPTYKVLESKLATLAYEEASEQVKDDLKI